MHKQSFFVKMKMGNKINSAPLESEIMGKRVVDLIAEITDGGKSSIRKRVKKYDLKKV